MESRNYAVLRIKKNTKRKLASAGKFQSYDQLIQELLSKWDFEK